MGRVRVGEGGRARRRVVGRAARRARPRDGRGRERQREAERGRGGVRQRAG
jgi:hypothetical protein